jgi:hypothetical protein
VARAESHFYVVAKQRDSAGLILGSDLHRQRPPKTNQVGVQLTLEFSCKGTS